MTERCQVGRCAKRKYGKHAREFGGECEGGVLAIPERDGLETDEAVPIGTELEQGNLRAPLSRTIPCCWGRWQG